MITLTREQFWLLERLLTKEGSQEAEQADRYVCDSLEEERVRKELQEMGYLDQGMVTERGRQAMEPYRAKRAVLIAAGFGSRMTPVTINTPKPLVRVGGKRMIDGLIEACLGAGIEEIYIVRGYLGEQFDQLIYPYPMVRFLENSMYREANNISSAMTARYLLSNAYVMEADLWIKNPRIIRPYHYASNFLGIRKEKTDDWCFVTENGIIKEEKVGGKDCYQMVGISYWNERDGRRLCHDIQKIYETPKGKERYWEQVPLVYCRSHYQVEIRKCREEDVAEIDTFGELQEADLSYKL